MQRKEGILCGFCRSSGERAWGWGWGGVQPWKQKKTIKKTGLEVSDTLSINKGRTKLLGDSMMRDNIYIELSVMCRNAKMVLFPFTRRLAFRPRDGGTGKPNCAAVLPFPVRWFTVIFLQTLERCRNVNTFNLSEKCRKDEKKKLKYAFLNCFFVFCECLFCSASTWAQSQTVN